MNIKYKHLILSQREEIYNGILKGYTKTNIAKQISKDKSTVGKEIKLHRFLSYRCQMKLECSNYKKCKFGRNCNLDCKNYEPFICYRRDVSPGACNGCKEISKCRFTKYKYNPIEAQKNYEKDLVDFRRGVDLTTDDVKFIADIVRPLLHNGQSIYQILHNHPEIKLCEKTLYNYINDGIFENFGINNIDLRMKVKRKMPKKLSVQYKKRASKKLLLNRRYTDYEIYMNDNPDASVVQMDTVYNDIVNGPFIQTFKFMKYSFLFAIIHKTKTSLDMCNGVNELEKILGLDLFIKNVEVILTDRGSEFYMADDMEVNKEGCFRTNLFYCDPMQSCQKGSIENNHIQLRYILPKHKDLTALGLNTQKDLNKVLSHINSGSKQRNNGKSPLEIMEFLNYPLFEKFNQYGIVLIDSDDILLKPSLLNK